MTHEVELWTDGSGQRGQIGFAWVLVHLPTGTMIEGRAAAINGTNNRAEMLAVIHGLSALKRPCRVQIVTDSAYVGKAYPRGWVDGWKRKRWHRVKNPDLWQQLDRLVSQHAVTWRWVRGHDGVELNERCDRLAGAARRKLIDALAAGANLRALPFAVIDLPAGDQLALAA